MPDDPQTLSAKLMMWPSEDYKAFKHINFSTQPDGIVAVVRKDRKIGILKLSNPEIPITELLVINVDKGCVVDVLMFFVLIFITNL